MGGVGSSHHEPFISVTHDWCVDVVFVLSYRVVMLLESNAHVFTYNKRNMFTRAWGPAAGSNGQWY